MSRSEFFQRAAQLYLDKISAEVITANLDNVYGEPESLEDVAFRRAVLTHFRELSKTDK
jgi:hypothetical protein